MRATRKSLHFDLNSAKLERLCALSENNISSRSSAYTAIREFLEGYGFEHRQGSGYTSEKGMSRAKVSEIVEEMVDKFPWFADCVEKIDVTFVGKTFDLLPTVCKGSERNKDFDKEDLLVRKALNFDLDNSALKIWYTKEDGTPKAHTNAYADIRSFLQKNGLEPRQGSGYLSTQEMTDPQISKIVENMTDQMPWLTKCVRSIDLTNVTKSFDLMRTVQKRRQQQIYDKISDVNSKGDAVLGDGHPKAVLNDIPKEERPYIEDVKDGIVVINDNAMAQDGYSFDRDGNIIERDACADKAIDKMESIRDAPIKTDERDDAQLGDEYGD